MPPVVLTPGEPAGIGPDICVQIAQRHPDTELVVIADPNLLTERAARLGLPLKLIPFDPGAPRPHTDGRLCILEIPLNVPCRPGHLDPANAPYVLETLRRATIGCLQGEFSALVTGPVHKGNINDAGLAFSGHTEFLANLCEADPVMMLTAPGLRVALVTTHLPLAEVSRHITQPLLSKVLCTLHRDLVGRFNLPDPCILVCGLNPHAGESGHLGREEIQVITPVLERLRKSGMRLEGPLAADTLFTPPYLERADAVLAMYHDQGLPVLKHMGFGRAVNVTLGLPIIRTSVDHGTALELAGTGRAHTGSLYAALEMAIELNPDVSPSGPKTHRCLTFR